MGFYQPNWSEFEVIFKYTNNEQCQKLVDYLKKNGFTPGLSPHFGKDGEYSAIKASRSEKRKAFIAGAKFAFENSLTNIYYYSNNNWLAVDKKLIERLNKLSQKPQL